VTELLPVVLATGNAGKAREFSRLLRPAFFVQPMPATVKLPPETGKTFAENARLKAQSVFAALGGGVAVLADDSGLEVAALGGRPGVLSARFAGKGAGDEENVGKLLREMHGRADREARFVCALCLVAPSRRAAKGASPMLEVEGVLLGTVTRTPRGTEGFGYDPVFQPDGWVLTLAEALPRDKDRVSHRGAAARALLEQVARLGHSGGEGSVRRGS
jgi:XTP/dITP diphosphohydrolase